ncbi:N-acetyltransferase [Nocardia uniformis]|uniref:N-acetyltransferase n=1 Tax=Nocardia uniformis TaxID=53432 RepID=A0A849BZW7_9NOCA|nr:N-acetyltransferase [Nocardia uniformis]
MGVLPPQPFCPEDIPGDVTVRAMTNDDWDAVLPIYGEGIATRNATFETEVPAHADLDATWLARHRWVAELDGEVVGWAALASVSTRDYYGGVAETSVYVEDGMCGRGVGKALARTQIIAADQDGLWTLQTSAFPENRASIALYRGLVDRTALRR